MPLTHSAVTTPDNSYEEIEAFEKFIRKLSITKREDDPKLVGKITAKIIQLKIKFPDEPKVYILKGILHQKINENRAALAAYKDVREKFPYYWWAYMYPARFLQRKYRYGEMKKILQPMRNLVNDAATPEDVKPDAKLLQEAEALLKEAEEFLEEERKENQRLAAERRKNRVSDLIEVHTVAQATMHARLFTQSKQPLIGTESRKEHSSMLRMGKRRRGDNA